jgi:hypothetical protein
MTAQFCTTDGCFDVAIGFGRWEGRGANRNPWPALKPDKCRPHHLERIADRIVRCEVTAPADVAIADVRTGDEVFAPNVVELDSSATNIAILVSLGYVKVLKAEQKSEAKPATKQV